MFSVGEKVERRSFLRAAVSSFSFSFSFACSAAGRGHGRGRGRGCGRVRQRWRRRAERVGRSRAAQDHVLESTSGGTCVVVLWMQMQMQNCECDQL